MGLLLRLCRTRAQLWRGIAEHLGRAAPEALVLVHPIAIGPPATTAHAMQVRFLHVRAEAYTATSKCMPMGDQVPCIGVVHCVLWHLSCCAERGAAVFLLSVQRMANIVVQILHCQAVLLTCKLACSFSCAHGLQ